MKLIKKRLLTFQVAVEEKIAEMYIAKDVAVGLSETETWIIYIATIYLGMENILAQNKNKLQI